MIKEKIEYYTPSIDELCDGVCFQEKVENKWIDTSYTTPYIPISPVTIRIRKLNERDILDLGFDKLAEASKSVLYVKANPSLKSNSSVQLRLSYVSSMPYITIYLGDTIILANCLIKNKYELVWLLNRLNLN